MPVCAWKIKDAYKIKGSKSGPLNSLQTLTLFEGVFHISTGWSVAHSPIDIRSVFLPLRSDHPFLVLPLLLLQLLLLLLMLLLLLILLRLLQLLLFNISSESIEIVQEYTYLGTRLTPTGNIYTCTRTLKRRGPSRVF